MAGLSKTQPKHNPMCVKYYAYTFACVSEWWILFFISIEEEKQNIDALMYLDKGEIRIFCKMKYIIFFFLMQNLPAFSSSFFEWPL